jgi:hypothetical protein
MITDDSTTTTTHPPAGAAKAPRVWAAGLLQNRVCTVPTWRGWALLLIVSTLVITVAGRHLCAFLSAQDSVPGGVLVIEGWVPAFAARATVAEFRQHHYVGIYVSGEPIEADNPYIQYGTYAELTAALVRKFGAPAESVHAVPALKVPKDRTYNAASRIKDALQAGGVSMARINVISVGPHGRRTRLLYERAFGPGSRIGIISLADPQFDADHWWRTSGGVRTVVGEAIAYCYARLIFQPAGQ